jgi:hypothetical protein
MSPSLLADAIGALTLFAIIYVIPILIDLRKTADPFRVK